MTTRGMQAITGNHTGYQDMQASVMATRLSPPVQEALYYEYPCLMSSPNVDRQGGTDKKKPLPQTRKGRRVLQHLLSVIPDNRLGLPRSFELWHRAPSASIVVATLSKPLRRECLFDPLSERLSTLPGSGVYVAREPHLPRNESLSQYTAGHAKHNGQCSEQKYTPLFLPCNPQCGKKIPRLGLGLKHE
jgi:hypothetical protein